MGKKLRGGEGVAKARASQGAAKSRASLGVLKVFITSVLV